MILLEENVSTLLHAVLILITVHDLPRVLTSSASCPGSNSYFEVMTFEVIGSNDVVIKQESGQKKYVVILQTNHVVMMK
jgi:hypothetical protein